MWIIWGWQGEVIAELKVTNVLLIAPELCRLLCDEAKKKSVLMKRVRSV